MPKARELGNVAKAVVSHTATLCAEQQDQFFEVVLLMEAGDKASAIRRLMEMAQANVTMLRAQTLLLADKLSDAEGVLIDARLKKQHANKGA